MGITLMIQGYDVTNTSSG